MKTLGRFLFCLSCFLSLSVFAEATVIDESENYAYLDNQQAAFEQLVETPQAKNDIEKAFAKEDTTANKSDNLILLNKLQGLQQELQELRGQLEMQSHQLKLLQEQQLSFYKDLDGRISNRPNNSNKIENKPVEKKWVDPNALENKSNAPITPLPVNKANRQNPAEEQISYLAAYEQIKNKQYDQALAAMNAFVAQYPQGGYTSNAHYWLGELHLVKKNYNEAITHFKIVLDQFPSSSKTAACMLKIGYAYAALGKKQEAVNQLQQVVKNFPDTNTAQLAKAKLETLNS